MMCARPGIDGLHVTRYGEEIRDAAPPPSRPLRILAVRMTAMTIFYTSGHHKV
jgi:hypothetical protein